MTQQNRLKQLQILGETIYISISLIEKAVKTDLRKWGQTKCISILAVLPVAKKQQEYLAILEWLKRHRTGFATNIHCVLQLRWEFSDANSSYDLTKTHNGGRKLNNIFGP